MTTELHRRLENVIRFGTISAVDYSAAKVRVKCGEIETNFIPFATARAGTSRSWSPPIVGEQCIILAMSGELTTACVLTGLYTQNAPSQSADEHVFVFADGAEIKYNQATGALSVTGIQTGNIRAETQIDVQCPTVNIEGNVNIKGNLSIAGSITTTSGNGSSGDVSIQGKVKATGDVIAGGISLQNHVHREQGDNRDTGVAK